MKKEKLLFLLTFLLVVHLSQSQLIMIDGETGEYEYEDVVMVDGNSQTQIQTRAKEWLDLYYVENDSISIEESSLSRSSVGTKFNWKMVKKDIPIEIFYDITIKIKDNKYKYQFSNFREGKKVRGEVDAKALKIYIERFPTRYQIYIEEPVDTEITNAIDSLEYYILNGALENIDDEW